MRNFKITNGFADMTDTDLRKKTDYIISQMEDNPAFPAPSPTLQEITATLDAFIAAVLAAINGDRIAVAYKHVVRGTLVRQLHLLGNYVLFVAAGDEIKAMTSGFTISKVPQATAAISVPDKLVLSNGPNRGELLRFRRVVGARAYMYQITPFPVTAESKWDSSLSTVCKMKFTGLERGREYACRVAAIGVKQQVMYSDVVSRIAL